MKVTANDIKNHRRECSEFYSKKISTKVSHYVSAYCINKRISPNTITAMMLVAGLISLLLLIQQNVIFQIIGALLLCFVNVFDSSDGEVARYTGNLSVLGMYYDKIFQLMVDISIFAVILYNQYRYFDSIIYIIPMIILIAFYIVDNYSKEVFAFLKIGNSVEKAKETKLEISYNKNSVFQFIVHITSSNTAFFHLYWIFLLTDVIFNTQYMLQFSFIVYVVILQIVKTIARQRKMISILRKG